MSGKPFDDKAKARLAKHIISGKDDDGDDRDFAARIDKGQDSTGKPNVKTSQEIMGDVFDMNRGPSPENEKRVPGIDYAGAQKAQRQDWGNLRTRLHKVGRK